MTAQEKFDQTVKDIRYFAPNFNVTLKKDSRFHAFVGKLFSKLGFSDYMLDVWTTIGQTCARPTICNNGATAREWEVAFHEAQHARDAASISSLLFGIIYLSPQIIGFLAVLYGLALPVMLYLGAPLACLWGLFGLLALLPLPALGRAYLEYRAYVVSLAIAFWTGNIYPGYIDWIVGHFTSVEYYYMFPFKGLVTAIFNKKLEELKTGTFALDSYLALIRTKCYQYKQE